MALEQVVQKFAGSALAVQHQNRVFQQILQMDALLIKLRIELSARHKGIGERVDRLVLQRILKMGVGKVRDNNIYLACLQQLHAFCGGLIRDLDMNIRVRSVKTAQIRNQKVPADRIAGPDPELSAAQRAGFHDLVLAALDQIHGRLHMAQQRVTLRSELHPLRTADKQIDAELLLQNLDRLADRGLGDIELLGCLGKT